MSLVFRRRWLHAWRNSFDFYHIQLISHNIISDNFKKRIIGGESKSIPKLAYQRQYFMSESHSKPHLDLRLRMGKTSWKEGRERVRRNVLETALGEDLRCAIHETCRVVLRRAVTASRHGCDLRLPPEVFQSKAFAASQRLSCGRLSGLCIRNHEHGIIVWYTLCKKFETVGEFFEICRIRQETETIVEFGWAINAAVVACRQNNWLIPNWMVRPSFYRGEKFTEKQMKMLCDAELRLFDLKDIIHLLETYLGSIWQILDMISIDSRCS